MHRGLGLHGADLEPDFQAEDSQALRIEVPARASAEGRRAQAGQCRMDHGESVECAAKSRLAEVARHRCAARVRVPCADVRQGDRRPGAARTARAPTAAAYRRDHWWGNAGTARAVPEAAALILA